MKSLNRVELIGNTGNEPELSTLNNGSTLVRISLATSDTFTDKQGEKKETTEWHTLIFWNKLAEVAAKYIKKGVRLYIDGRLNYSQYEKDGVTKYSTDIIVKNFIILDKKEDDIF